jgi:hypothetical protein
LWRNHVRPDLPPSGRRWPTKWPTSRPLLTRGGSRQATGLSRGGAPASLLDTEKITFTEGALPPDSSGRMSEIEGVRGANRGSSLWEGPDQRQGSEPTREGLAWDIREIDLQCKSPLLLPRFPLVGRFSFRPPGRTEGGRESGRPPRFDHRKTQAAIVASRRRLAQLTAHLSPASASDSQLAASVPGNPRLLPVFRQANRSPLPLPGRQGFVARGRARACRRGIPGNLPRVREPAVRGDHERLTASEVFRPKHPPGGEWSRQFVDRARRFDEEMERIAREANLGRTNGQKEFTHER